MTIINVGSSNGRHPWKFFRVGGVDQVNLRSGADIAALEKLDQKLWVALSCPTRGLEFDTKTLDLIDTDLDGRIRAPEILAAIKWLSLHLKSFDSLVQGSEFLPLSAINDATPEGKQVLASAKQILANLSKPAADAISVADTMDTVRIFAQTKFNGDGIVPVESAEDDATKAVLTDIITCLGAETDRSGAPGVTEAKAFLFFAEAQAYSDWWKKAELEAATVLPLGEATAAAVAAYRAVKGKVDDYFARCRLAAFDGRALVAVNRQESEYLALAAKDLSINAVEVAGFPLARIEGGKPLPLKLGVNPAWADAVALFATTVVKPLVGEKEALTEEDWLAISTRLGVHETWSGSKAGAAIEKLGLARVREILASPAKENIAKLIERDKALEPESAAIASVDKLVRYHRDFYQLLNNYVSFGDFYSRKRKAIFQIGTLFLDSRSCDLCLKVEDMAKHASMAAMSGTYLAYCDCVRKASGEKMTIAAAFTGGDSDDLIVGRNGIFYDRQGRDWDATIIKIVDAPISIRQAFWSPYKKLIRMVEEQVAKRAAAADAEANKELTQAADAAANIDKKAVEVKKEPPKKFDVGTVAALGVALGSLATAAGVVFTKLAEIAPWKVAFVVLAVILAISLPSVILAALKLRKRNLAPLLDANGWAVNCKARMNIPFGGSLTAVAELPEGSTRDLVDPFAEKPVPWRTYATIIILAIVAYMYSLGRLDDYLLDFCKKSTLFPDKKPTPVGVTNGTSAATNTPSVTVTNVVAAPTNAPAPAK